MGRRVAFVVGWFFVGVGFVRRQAGRWAFARGKVGRLQFDLLVMITLERGVEGGFEGIDEGYICFFGHGCADELMGRIDDETAEIFIGEIDGRSERGAKGAAFGGAIGGRVFMQPSQWHHGLVLRTCDCFGLRIEGLGYLTAKQDGGDALIEVLDAINISGGKDFTHTAKDVVLAVGRFDDGAGAFFFVGTVVTHPSLTEDLQAKV